MKKNPKNIKALKWLGFLLLAVFLTGCDTSGKDPILGGNDTGSVIPPDTTAPMLTAVSAPDGSIGLAINRDITATFNELMDESSLISSSPSTDPLTTTFTVCNTGAVQGGACLSSVEGVVTYTGMVLTFRPNANLALNTWYTSSISSSAKDLAGNALPVPSLAGGLPNPWSWQTSAVADITPPVITATSPADLETGVAVNKTVNATFNEEIRQSTMITSNFTLAETATLTSVPGSVFYDVQNNIASFVPQSDLLPDTEYRAQVSDSAVDLAGNALLVPAVLLPNNPWTFRTAAATVAPLPLAVNLRGADSFGIASQAGLTSTGITVVNGDVALYPLAACADATGNAGASQTCLVKTYASPTGMTVNGSIYWAGDPHDNGGTANSVSNDLNIAWNEARNKVMTEGPVTGDELGGKTLTPGVYRNATLGLQAGGIVTMDALGDANAIFVFQVDSSLVDSGTLLLPSSVVLVNGAQARNIWFVTGLDITIGSGTTWHGNILAGRDATVLDGSTVTGRVLAGASGAGAFTLTGAASPSVITIIVP